MFDELHLPVRINAKKTIPVELRIGAGEWYFVPKEEEEAIFSNLVGEHRAVVKSIMEARWGNSSGARHVGSDVAKWLVKA